MNYIQRLSSWFQELPGKQKISFSFALIILLLLTTLVSWWALSPSYGVLFSHLDERDAQNIITQLERDHIAYELGRGGSEVLIAQELIAKTRLNIMASSLHLSNNVGFELFDKNDFGMTDFSQKINYQRALQGELERTISGFDEISQARVHLVIPETHLFDNKENQPKAAVTVHLKKALTRQQVQSIQHLVSASVAHLTMQNVVVVDHNGTTLSAREEDHSTHHFTAKKAMEHYLNDKVLRILGTIFPKNQVMVTIDVSINYDELQRELIKPQAQGLVTHEKESKHTTQDKTEKKKTDQDTSSEKFYQFGSEKELFKRASGTIEHLSVSVVLPQNTDEQTIHQVQSLVKNAVGFNETRGDLISVEGLIIKPQKVHHHDADLAPQLTSEKTFYSFIDKQFIPYFLFALLCSITTGAVLIKRIHYKKRQLMLIELTQWLSHHES